MTSFSRSQNLRAAAALLFFCGFVSAQNFPYILQSFAGTFPLGDNGPAKSALLSSPDATAVVNGELYILDTGNRRIRRVSGTGIISTFATPVYAYDMKSGPDGTLYVSGYGAVWKVGRDGVVTRIAGTGEAGAGVDGVPAVSTQVGAAFGIAVDSSGNVYFTDVFAGRSRVRLISVQDGNISRINPDGLHEARGIAVDKSGAIYVANSGLYLIQKFVVGGVITTVAGNLLPGVPRDGPARASSVGFIGGLTVDASGTLYATDNSNGAILRITSDGTLTRVAGALDQLSSPGDGPALQVSLLSPRNTSVGADGSVYVGDLTHVVRQLTPDGNMKVVAGKPHYGGDGGPATSALFNSPQEVAVDAQGNVYVADSSNFRIRKIARDGKIATFVGNGLPRTGASTPKQVPYITCMATDKGGTLYFAGYFNSTFQVFKVTQDGDVTVIAGTGTTNFQGGESGPAVNVALRDIGGIAVDGTGAVYIAEWKTAKVKKIARDGTISVVAGTGTAGKSGDGGPATLAQLALGERAPLAVDSKGNLYIGDTNNSVVRKVTAATGVISTVAGNGSFGRPDGVPAAASPLPKPGGIAIDAADNVYLSSQQLHDLYRVSPTGQIDLLSGGGVQAPKDGLLARSTSFPTTSLAVDANGDLYALSAEDNVVRKLILNSPASIVNTNGNNQSGVIGSILPTQLRVEVVGRAGINVGGVRVEFAIQSGDATVVNSTAVTNTSGTAFVSVKLGLTAGTVTIVASVPGTTIPPVTMTATTTANVPGCSLPKPVITSLATAGDFGGSATIAQGSWVEIKGINLAPKTRQWAPEDFDGPNAPIRIDGVGVRIAGYNAYVSYISPTQINAQVPTIRFPAVATISLSSSECSVSDSFPIRLATFPVPGVLAPSAFRVGGKQYVAATFSDGRTFVGRENLIAGAPFRPAVPGDNVTVYGIGFGPVSPDIAPGVIVAEQNSLDNVSIQLDSVDAVISYAGLAPNVIGLYQFNFVVPDVPAGDHVLTVNRGSAAAQPELYFTTDTR